MEKFDPDKLAKGNGQEGNPTLVVYDGKVYDLSGSPKWKNGKHMMRHPAGQDLTSELSAAPHGPEVFERFLPVGEYEAAETEDGPKVFWPLNVIFEKIPFLRRHPHPLTVHFPIAFLFGAFAFMVLYLIFKNPDFERVTFWLLLSGTLTAPVAVITGFQSWWLFYGSSAKGKLLFKIILGPMVFFVGLVLTIWYLVNPEVLTAAGTGMNLFVAVMVLNMILLSIVGTIGGQLTFPE